MVVVRLPLADGGMALQLGMHHLLAKYAILNGWLDRGRSSRTETVSNGSMIDGTFRSVAAS